MDAVLPFETSRMNNPDRQRSIPADLRHQHGRHANFHLTTLHVNWHLSLTNLVLRPAFVNPFIDEVIISYHLSQKQECKKKRCQNLSLWRLIRRRWSRGLAPSIFILGPKRSLNPKERTPGANWIAGGVFSRVTLDCLEKKKTYFSCRESKRETSSPWPSLLIVYDTTIFPHKGIN
jgi:hypothetical protein